MPADPKLLAAAIDLYEAGRLRESCAVLEQLAAADPADARLWHLLGAVALRLDEAEPATAALTEAARSRLPIPLSACCLPMRSPAAGRADEAVAAGLLAVELDPRSAAACCKLAELYVARGEFDDTARWARQAIALAPESVAAHNLLGAALFKSGKAAEAVAVMRRATQLPGGGPQLLGNLGLLLDELGQQAAAIETFRESLTLVGPLAETFYNLGNSHRKLAEFDEAINNYDRAIALDPEHADAHVGLANVLLARGDYGRGWAEYEWRFRGRAYPHFDPPCKIWNGEPLAGRTIVLVAEQGMGDTMQLIRYAPLIKSLGPRVLVLATRVLHPILAQAPGVDGWLAPGDAVVADFCLPLLSAPHRLGTTVDTIPAVIPYLFAEPERVAAWRVRLAPIEGLRIGIAWRGAPGYFADRQRSIPPALLAPLSAVPGVRLVSLQKGATSDELAALSPAGAVADFGEGLDPSGAAFMDTAAIVANLDLVIACDTSIAHLAGGMGASVWLALQRVTDWRWPIEGTATPWYPNMRLFRQRQAGDWPGVVAAMTAELENLAAGQSRRSIC